MTVTSAVRRSFGAVVLLITSSQTLVAAGREAPDRERHMVRVLTPAFRGTADIGVRVRTVLNLQILNTLNVPANNPKSEGAVIWAGPMEEQSHEFALRAARSAGAQVTLWGDAVEYANGVIVQAAMTVDAQAEHTATRALRWETNVQYAQQRFLFRALLPSPRYEFEPIVLAPEIVRQFREPSDLVMYSQIDGGRALGTVGDEFDTLERRGDRIRVTSSGITGWVHLPRLSATRSEIVDFVSGVVRVMRHDWRGAERALSAVIENPVTPSKVLQDAFLYRAFARAGLKQPCRADIKVGRAVNPYVPAVELFGIVCAASEFETARLADREVGMATAITDLEQIFRTKKVPLSDDDSTVASARALIQTYRRSTPKSR